MGGRLQSPQCLHRLMTEVRVSLVSEVGAERSIQGAVPKWGGDVEWEVNGENGAQPVNGGTFKFVIFLREA